MTAYVEVWKPGGVELVPLTGDRVTVGRGPDNDIALTEDRMVSSHHALLEAVAEGWCLQDLGSRNGSMVAGQPISGIKALRHGDEVTIGRTRLVFRATEPASLTETVGDAPPPELTRRERDVLRELCRPLFSGQMYAEAATLREIATALVVSEAAVQQHLLNLYDKFAIDSSGTRRGKLANAALRRGAVSAAEFRRSTS